MDFRPSFCVVVRRLVIWFFTNKVIVSCFAVFTLLSIVLISVRRTTSCRTTNKDKTSHLAHCPHCNHALSSMTTQHNVHHRTYDGVVCRMIDGEGAGAATTRQCCTVVCFCTHSYLVFARCVCVCCVACCAWRVRVCLCCSIDEFYLS